LPSIPIKRRSATLGPNPEVAPTTPPGEARPRSHQAFSLFPPKVYYHVHQRIAPTKMSPDLPMQMLWGFDGTVPGPTYVARYGDPVLVRNVNELPGDNGGVGLSSVATHLPQRHTPPASDGLSCGVFSHSPWCDHPPPYPP